MAGAQSRRNRAAQLSRRQDGCGETAAARQLRPLSRGGRGAEQSGRVRNSRSAGENSYFLGEAGALGPPRIFMFAGKVKRLSVSPWLMVTVSEKISKIFSPFRS